MVRGVNVGNKHNYRHGHAAHRTPTYVSWSNMIQRATNSNHPRYPDWGGRGIRVCDRWLKFAHFLEDMGDRPEHTTLDRVDVDGHYEPSNCRWATRIEQERNKRINR